MWFMFHPKKKTRKTTFTIQKKKKRKTHSTTTIQSIGKFTAWHVFYRGVNIHSPAVRMWAFFPSFLLNTTNESVRTTNESFFFGLISISLPIYWFLLSSFRQCSWWFFFVFEFVCLPKDMPYHLFGNVWYGINIQNRTYQFCVRYSLTHINQMKWTIEQMGKSLLIQCYYSVHAVYLGIAVMVQRYQKKKTTNYYYWSIGDGQKQQQQ